MKIKLLIASEDYSEAEYGQAVIREGITDWEEVTDEEYDFIRANLHRLVQVEYGKKVILVSEDDKPLSYRIKNLKALIAAEKRKEETEKAERARKKQERELKKRAKSEAQEIALLASLKEKYGEK